MTTASDLSAARTESARLFDLLRREQHAMAEFLVALAIFDEQRRWDALGYGTLFDYLHRKLGLPKSAAFYRMTAAHLVQKYPAAIEPLRTGKLCLSTLAEHRRRARRAVGRSPAPSERGDHRSRSFAYISSNVDAPRRTSPSGPRVAAARQGA
jgi:hypothetical protein